MWWAGMAVSHLLLFSWYIQASTTFCPHEGRKLRRQFPCLPHWPVHTLVAAFARWEWACYSAHLPGSPTGSLLSFSAHLVYKEFTGLPLHRDGVCSQASCGENIKENHFSPLFPDPWEYKQQIQFNSLSHNTQNISSDSRNKAITRPLPKLLNNA